VRRACATGSSAAPNGKRRLAGDTARAATTDEVKTLRHEARTLKEVAAEQALGRDDAGTACLDQLSPQLAAGKRRQRRDPAPIW
jgi:hypothetical protein